MLKVKFHHQGMVYGTLYHLYSTTNKMEVSYHALVFVGC